LLYELCFSADLAAGDAGQLLLTCSKFRDLGIEGSDPAGSEPDRFSKGCGCRFAGEIPNGRSAAWLLLGLLLGVRRRSRG
jgi:MYXO-CTERM domain-containing protein